LILLVALLGLPEPLDHIPEKELGMVHRAYRLEASLIGLFSHRGEVAVRHCHPKSRWKRLSAVIESAARSP
jgi:hypothetical protein